MSHVPHSSSQAVFCPTEQKRCWSHCCHVLLVAEMPAKLLPLQQTVAGLMLSLSSPGIWDAIGLSSTAEALGLTPLPPKPSGSLTCPLPPDRCLVDWLILVWEACDENRAQAYCAFRNLKALSRARQPPPWLLGQRTKVLSLFSDCCQLTGIASYLKSIKEGQICTAATLSGISSFQEFPHADVEFISFIHYCRMTLPQLKW